MTFLPIVERELRVRARQPGTYNGRWIAVLIAFLLSLPLLTSNNPRGGPSDGKSLFTWLTVLAFAYCLLGGARLTSNSLAGEKREGTLGLLFLTHLKGYDVVLGKLVACSLSSFYGLLAIMPVFGIALLAGGVTGGEFWRVTLVLVNTLFFSLALGLWVSARSHDEQKIMAGTNLLLIALAWALPLLDYLVHGNAPHNNLLSLPSPGFGCYLAFDLIYKTSPGDFWISLGLVHSLGWMFLALAAQAIVRYQQEHLSSEQSPGQAPDNSIPSAAQRLDQRRSMLSENPIFWLAHQQPGQKTLIWSITALRVGVSLLILLMTVLHRGTPTRAGMIYWPQILSQLVTLLFWFVVATVACRFFTQARRNGTLELLFSTPIRESEILEGLSLHLQKLLLRPLVCIWGVHCFTLVFWQLSTPRVGAGVEIFGNLLVSGGLLLTESIALCWVSVWLALSCEKPAQAATRAFVYVVLLPWIFCSGAPFYIFVPFLGFRGGPGPLAWVGVGTSLILMVIHAIFFLRARHKLMLEGMRRIAVRQVTCDPPRQLWDPKNDLSENFSLLK